MLYFLLFLAVLLLPIWFRLKADTSDGALIIQAEFMLFRFFKIRFLKKSITVKKVISSFLKGRKNKHGKARIFTNVREHTRIKMLDIRSSIGTGNAASTAMLSGQVFGLAAPLVANASENYNIDIIPVFDKKQFDLELECVLSTNIANIIVAVCKMFGGKNGRSSY